MHTSASAGFAPPAFEWCATQARMQACVRSREHGCVHTRMHACTHAGTHVHTLARSHACSLAGTGQARRQMAGCATRHRCPYTCLCTCLYTCLFTLCTCLCTCMRMYLHICSYTCGLRQIMHLRGTPTAAWFESHPAPCEPNCTDPDFGGYDSSPLLRPAQAIANSVKGRLQLLPSHDTYVIGMQVTDRQ